MDHAARLMTGHGTLIDRLRLVENQMKVHSVSDDLSSAIRLEVIAIAGICWYWFLSV